MGVANLADFGTMGDVEMSNCLAATTTKMKVFILIPSHGREIDSSPVPYITLDTDFNDVIQDRPGEIRERLLEDLMEVGLIVQVVLPLIDQKIILGGRAFREQLNPHETKVQLESVDMVESALR